MAKKITEVSKAAKGISPNDLKRVINDINRHRENASENSGLAGQAVKQAVEQYKIDRPALMAVVRLNRSEPTKRQATLRGIIEYADKMGFFDQVDAFDDLIPILEAIVKRVRGDEDDAPAKSAKPDAPTLAEAMASASTH